MIILQFVTEPWYTIASPVIQWVTWSDYSHVDIVLPDGNLLGSRLRGGVKIRPAHYAKWTNVLHAQVDAPDVAYDIAKSQIGKPYDWQGILNFGFHIRDARNWRSTDSWFCSEFVAWVFEQSGVPLLNPHTYIFRITPRDLLLAPRLQY